MTKKIVKVLENKCVYVDIDGTLAEYRFNDHVSAKDGSTNGQTLAEIKKHVFLKSRPLKSVIRILKKVKTDKIWICGAVISPIEVLDKRKWLDLNCKGVKFNNYNWFVSDEYWDEFLMYFTPMIMSNGVFVNEYGTFFRGSKNLIWDWIISHHLHNIEDTVFIDDVLPYLKYAEEKGITAYHISSFIE